MQFSSSATQELQHLLTIPPSGFHTTNPSAVAHAALQALRDAGDEHFLFLRTILEHSEASQSEELLFHCLAGCRHVMLHKWATYSPTFRNAVRDYVLAWGHDTSLPRTVRLACYTTAASFWKRQWNEDGSANEISRMDEQPLIEAMRRAQPQMISLQSKQELFSYLETLLQTQLASAATFLSVLVGEFMGKSAVQYQLTLEFHKMVHASFERDGWLDQCLKLSMGALGHVVSSLSSAFDENVALAAVQLTIDVIGWEFGTDAWDSGMPHTTKMLLRPPISWREYLVRQDFVGAVFHLHELVVHHHAPLAHALRQLVLLLASLSGPILVDQIQRKAFASYLVDGTLKILSASTFTETQENSGLLDALSIISRLIANFKLSTLVELPTLVPLLSAITATGTALLQANVTECQSVKGDVESMEHCEWREEALVILLDGIVLLCGDPWLFYSGTDESRQIAQSALANAVGPLYNEFVSCRVHMARLEEHYSTERATELDEVREGISAVDLEEEMTSVAVIGRLSLSISLASLSLLLHRTLSQVQTLWDSSGMVDVTPEGAAALEEARLLTMCVGHLLTDDNSGETPAIPDAIVMACQNDNGVSNAIASVIQSIMSLAEMQASRIAISPSDPRLSPLLATSFLWLLNRWAPAYILPSDYSSAGNNTPSHVFSLWSREDAAKQVVSFCATLTLHYQCYWPQERQVQDGAESLIFSLAKRGTNIRKLLMDSTAFTQMVTFHCFTAGMSHNASSSELEARIAGSSTSLDMVRGYQRLPYEERANILTALLTATCDAQHERATAMFNECLSAVHKAFSSLVQALVAKQVSPGDVNAQEMASLCVTMYCGVARASEINEPERIVQFITPSLPHLSGLMSYYAKDLTICEGLLRLFRDYTEQFVAILDRDQSLVLFQASAALLKSYSTHHCSSRVIKRQVVSSAEADVEEEQKYSDVLCAIQVLIHLGTKDFIDICTSGTTEGVDSGEITDVIFFGLQQIIPLMTQGLLQFPTLCTQYFSLAGFMMDTYPDKVCILPYKLFDALLESLLFGMSHMDPFVSKSSLNGIAGLAREHLQNRTLDPHLAQHPEIFDKCASRLLQEVVFQTIVWDRLETCGMALLPLAAVDIQRFAAVVNSLAQQIPAEHQQRLQAAFQKMIQPEVLSKISSRGYEGRMNRIRFKKDFEDFVKDVHSFVVIK